MMTIKRPSKTTFFWPPAFSAIHRFYSLFQKKRTFNSWGRGGGQKFTLLPQGGATKKKFGTKCVFLLEYTVHHQRCILTSKIGYTLDSVEPEYLRECSGVNEKVHDSPASTRLIQLFISWYFSTVHLLTIGGVPFVDPFANYVLEKIHF